MPGKKTAKRVIGAVLTVLIALSLVPPVPSVAKGNYGDTVINMLADTGETYAERAKNIANEYSKIRGFNSDNPYSVKPQITAPYTPGRLNSTYIQRAEDALNFARYTAGLPNDVKTTANLNELSQYGAVLLLASGYLSHTPGKPGDMDQAFYEQGYKSTSSSNIAQYKYSLKSWYTNAQLLETTFGGWLADEDRSNIAVLGHRRWALNPQMQYTGFGQADGYDGYFYSTYSVMYSMDRSRSETVDYEAIGYPSGAAFPVELFENDYPWSITVNPKYYQTPNINTVTVTLSDGSRTWNFSRSDTRFEGNYFNVDRAGYGVPNCIVFRPAIANGPDYTKGGTYTVTVNGLKTIDGKDASLTYKTKFFSVFDSNIPETPVETPVPTEEPKPPVETPVPTEEPKPPVETPVPTEEPKPPVETPVPTEKPEPPVKEPDNPSDWSKPDIEDARDWGLIPKAIDNFFKNSITRAEFCQLVVPLCETIIGELTPSYIFKDTFNEDVCKVASIGIVNGVGDSNFDPDGLITRQQAATILGRMMDSLGKPLPKSQPKFEDNCCIDGWAIDWVGKVQGENIMNGMDDGCFNPEGAYTKEQSIVTVLRVWNNICI